MGRDLLLSRQDQEEVNPITLPLVLLIVFFFFMYASILFFLEEYLLFEFSNSYRIHINLIMGLLIENRLQ